LIVTSDCLKVSQIYTTFQIIPDIFLKDKLVNVTVSKVIHSSEGSAAQYNSKEISQVPTANILTLLALSTERVHVVSLATLQYGWRRKSVYDSLAVVGLELLSNSLTGQSPNQQT
jgi:hypothetical protein